MREIALLNENVQPPHRCSLRDPQRLEVEREQALRVGGPQNGEQMKERRVFVEVERLPRTPSTTTAEWREREWAQRFVTQIVVHVAP
ncbi:MAG TPA: hypothetical protein VGM29_01495, partial [Polyangiaceae bacterium]